jgi:hypothetical protein
MDRLKRFLDPLLAFYIEIIITRIAVAIKTKYQSIKRKFHTRIIPLSILYDHEYVG